MSRDVVSTATLCGGYIALVSSAGIAAATLLDLTRTAAAAADGHPAAGVPSAALHTFMLAAGPTMIGAAAGAVVATAAQLGGRPAFRRLGFDLARRSPVRDLPTTLSLSGVARRAGTVVTKLVLIGAIVALALRSHRVGDDLEAASLGALVFSLARRTLGLVLGALAVLAAVDYLVARRKLTGELRCEALGITSGTSGHAVPQDKPTPAGVLELARAPLAEPPTARDRGRRAA
jgi:flagellar biosynthesis protein FlhB